MLDRLRHPVRALTCWRGRHRWRSVAPAPIETSDGPWMVVGECRRCGLLEGGPGGMDLRRV